MANDFISREAAVKILRKCEALYRRAMKSQVRADMVGHCIRLIGEVPAADVRPVVRGTWKHINNRCDGYAWQICSERGEKGKSTWNYCRNCGADMREVKTDEK